MNLQKRRSRQIRFVYEVLAYIDPYKRLGPVSVTRGVGYTECTLYHQGAPVAYEVVVSDEIDFQVSLIFKHWRELAKQLKVDIDLICSVPGAIDLMCIVHEVGHIVTSDYSMECRSHEDIQQFEVERIGKSYEEQYSMYESLEIERAADVWMMNNFKDELFVQYLIATWKALE